MTGDTLKQHFVRTAPRGPDLPGPGKYPGDIFTVVKEDGTEVVHEWADGYWVSDLQASPFTPFGLFLLGPNPTTAVPNSWLYWRTSPPTPLSADDNEKAEKLAADIFNREAVR